LVLCCEAAWKHLWHQGPPSLQLLLRAALSLQFGARGFSAHLLPAQLPPWSPALESLLPYSCIHMNPKPTP
jgi:hypothetical protein